MRSPGCSNKRKTIKKDNAHTKYKERKQEKQEKQIEIKKKKKRPVGIKTALRPSLCLPSLFFFSLS
jgi:hypothetical protein